MGWVMYACVGWVMFLHASIPQWRFFPWSIFSSKMLDQLLWASFIANIHVEISIINRHSSRFSLRCLVQWMNHLPTVQWSGCMNHHPLFRVRFWSNGARFIYSLAIIFWCREENFYFKFLLLSLFSDIVIHNPSFGNYSSSQNSFEELNTIFCNIRNIFSRFF